MRKILLLTASLLAACQMRPLPAPVAAAPAAAQPAQVVLANYGMTELHGPMPGLPGPGEEFRGAVDVYGRQFPLPPGLWTVSDSRALAHEHAGPMTGELILSQSENGVLRGLVSVGTNANAYSPETKLNTVCTASDVLLNDMKPGSDLAHQDCMALNYYRLVLARQTPAAPLGATLQLLDQLGVQTPNMVVGFMLFESSATGRLHEEWLMNPDLDGVRPDAATLRAQSAWAPYNYAKDPAKITYLARLRANAATVRDLLRREVNRPPAHAGGALTSL